MSGYEAIALRALAEYRELILPDQYAMLEGLGTDPGEAGALCIGARDEGSGEAVGAVLGIMTEDEDGTSIYLRSITVRPDMRRRGIGRTLLGRLLTVASGTYPFSEGQESAPVTLKAVYELEWAREQVMTAFLEDFGMSGIVEQPDMYRLGSMDLMLLDILRPDMTINKNVRPLSEAGEELVTGIEELMGYEVIPELSFAYVRGDEVAGVIAGHQKQQLGLGQQQDIRPGGSRRPPAARQAGPERGPAARRTAPTAA